MNQAMLRLLAGSFSLAIILSSYATAGLEANDITQSDKTTQTSVSEQAAAWDTTRYTPVYGHLPYWSKRLGYWIVAEE